MKNFLLLLLTTTLTVVKAQQKFIFDASYGIAYVDNYMSNAKILPPDSKGNLDFQTKNFGQAINFNLEYKVFRNSYLGIGYLSEFYRTKVNEKYGSIEQVNFYNNEYLQAYDVHYSKYFQKLSLSGGVFWYNTQGNTANFANNGTLFQLVGGNEKRADDLGGFVAVGYQYPVYQYLSIGLKAKAYISFFEGFTTATLAPYISFKF